MFCSRTQFIFISPIIGVSIDPETSKLDFFQGASNILAS